MMKVTRVVQQSDVDYTSVVVRDLRKMMKDTVNFEAYVSQENLVLGQQFVEAITAVDALDSVLRSQKED